MISLSAFGRGLSDRDTKAFLKIFVTVYLLIGVLSALLVAFHWGLDGARAIFHLRAGWLVLLAVVVAWPALVVIGVVQFVRVLLAGWACPDSVDS